MCLMELEVPKSNTVQPTCDCRRADEVPLTRRWRQYFAPIQSWSEGSGCECQITRTYSIPIPENASSLDPKRAGLPRELDPVPSPSRQVANRCEPASLQRRQPQIQAGPQTLARQLPAYYFPVPETHSKTLMTLLSSEVSDGHIVERSS
jgi:hypothetical protein